MTAPMVNEHVVYRSQAGEQWDAVVTGLPVLGFVNVLVRGPGLADGMELHAVRWYDDPAEKRPGARPRRGG